MSDCCGPGLPTPTIFSGMTRAQLQATFVSFQAAYFALISGTKVIQATYSQGDGTRSTTFTTAQAPMLLAYMMQLQQLLGLSGGRRPMRFVYGGARCFRPW